MMRKVVIFTPSEYEPLILEELGRLKVIQLKEVSGGYAEELSRLREEIDYAALYERYHQRYVELRELLGVETKAISPTEEELRRLTTDPEGEVERTLGELSGLRGRLTALEERQGEERRRVEEEREAELEERRRCFEDERERIESEIGEIERRHREVSWNISLAKLMGEVDIKESLAVGVVDKGNLERMRGYLTIHKDVEYKAFDIYGEDTLLVVYGPAERRDWIEALFLVFKVRNLMEVLKERKLTAILDPEKRAKKLKKLEEELKKLEERRREIPKLKEKLKKLEEKYRRELEEIEARYDEELRRLEERHREEREKLLTEVGEALRRAAFLDYALHILSLSHPQTLRTRVIAVIEGWLPEEYAKRFEEAMRRLSERFEGAIHYEYAEISEEEIPPSKPRVPSILRPFYVLTRMVGIPNPRELNPTVLFTAMWILMFGFMFPDIGQGILIAALGFLFAYVIKKRLMGLNFVKVGKLWIGLGISSAFFGALFGEFFLLEIHPILFKPLWNIWTMIKIALFVGMFEIAFALILGAINRFRMGDKIGALMGERGLGGLLLYAGIVWMIFTFWSIRGLKAFTSPAMGVTLAGIAVIFLEPFVHAKLHHGGEGGLDLLFQGFGAAFDSVISLLSNTVSFARLAGFALAHVALAEVVHALSEISVGLGIFGLVFMNFLAMSIEFMVVIIQSLRLLYYEFSTKFYFGDGTPFKPFRVPTVRVK